MITADANRIIKYFPSFSYSEFFMLDKESFEPDRELFYRIKKFFQDQKIETELLQEFYFITLEFYRIYKISKKGDESESKHAKAKEARDIERFFNESLSGKLQVKSISFYAKAEGKARKLTIKTNHFLDIFYKEYIYENLMKQTDNLTALGWVTDIDNIHELQARPGRPVKQVNLKLQNMNKFLLSYLIGENIISDQKEAIILTGRFIDRIGILKKMDLRPWEKMDGKISYNSEYEYYQKNLFPDVSNKTPLQKA